MTTHDDAITRDEDQFGSNEWLIDEMRERFEADPSAVSESWREFFAANGVGSESNASPPPASQTTAPPAPDVPAPEAPAPDMPAPEAPVPEAPVPDAPAPAAARPPTAPPPAKPATEGSATGSTPSPDGRVEPEAASEGSETVERSPLVGITATIAKRMDESLEVPTATSVRTIPSKLLEVNRLILNNQLKRLIRGGKVSFTHLIGYAVARAMAELPGMNVSYEEIDGKPHRLARNQVNLGLAIDVERPDGTRVLLVPNIKGADALDFRSFWHAYERIVEKARRNKLELSDFAETTATLTNPGTIGTVQSVPRLMPDQGLIVGVGAIAYPPEYQAADPGYLARTGIGRVITITSTYDHRVIQGAQSGEFLKRIHELLLGEDRFYDDIFRSLDMPYTPARWATDDNPPPGSSRWSEKQANVFWLINAYRVRGHLIADLDPLRQKPPQMYKELDPLHYGLTIWDLEREYATGGLGDANVMTLGRILSVLRDAYCRTVGIEYMHIQETSQKAWVQRQVEVQHDGPSREERIRILHKLNQAEAFEKFLHTKYVGHKRFGLEGAESLIPMLDAIAGAAAADGMDEVVIGMAHRGRLNVLANIIGKGYDKIFREFEGDLDPETTGGSGDVKYHLGATGKYDTEDGPIGVEVVANPSHLEAVDPVLEGVVRAKQERRGPAGHTEVLPVLIHGDAAFAGQGVVVETFNLSQLRGYRTGGTVHIVINNQVGFTTSTLDARSSFYATDVAKTVQAPIIHVNGDDPEAVARVARLAFAFRQTFHKDVVIDMICYRRRGHNEGDEPSYTQPLMYKLIEEHESVRTLYLRRLVGTGELSMEDGEQLLNEFRGLMEAAFQETRTSEPRTGNSSTPEPRVEVEAATAVAESELREILSYLTQPPEGFEVHPKLRKLLTDRAAVFESGVVDWATAEALAFGSLARQGVPVRLAGEDSRRGTFSHRHAELTDFNTGEDWIPLQTMTAPETRVRIVDSLLSEFAAVGFEYGYSVEWPEAFVLWEAQFGDFANGAQVVVDQFIAAGEAKWGQQSLLTMLLPHGYEGQGPEHSSARIERYLELCAEDNLRVVIPATSGQYFHLLRRQALLRPAKPLIVFTPKSLLRAKPAFSPTRWLSEGRFEPVVLEDRERAPDRLVLCAGKVYHDLVKLRDERDLGGVEIVRLSQLYPLPSDQLAEIADRVGDATLVWCQEEPENMGAYRFVWPRLREVFGREPEYAGRPAAASTATGSAKVHAAQQQALVRAGLGLG